MRSRNGICELAGGAPPAAAAPWQPCSKERRGSKAAAAAVAAAGRWENMGGVSGAGFCSSADHHEEFIIYQEVTVVL